MKMNVGHLPSVHFGLGQGNFFIDFYYFAAGLLTDRKGIHHGKDVGQTVVMVAVPVAVMFVMVVFVVIVFVMIRLALVLFPAVEDDPEVRAADAVTEEFSGGIGYVHRFHLHDDRRLHNRHTDCPAYHYTRTDKTGIEPAFHPPRRHFCCHHAGFSA